MLSSVMMNLSFKLDRESFREVGERISYFFEAQPTKLSWKKKDIKLSKFYKGEQNDSFNGTSGTNVFLGDNLDDDYRKWFWRKRQP